MNSLGVCPQLLYGCGLWHWSDYCLVLCHLHEAQHFWNPDPTQAHLLLGLLEAYSSIQSYCTPLILLWPMFSNILARKLRRWLAEKVRLPQSYTEVAYSSKNMVTDLKTHLGFFVGQAQEWAWWFLSNIPSWQPRHCRNCCAEWSCKNLCLKRVKEKPAHLGIIAIAWQRVMKT